MKAPAFAIPRGSVLLLSIVCFLLFLTEGAMLDRSTVYLTQFRGIMETLGGLGFTCFTIAMTILRLTGGRVAEYFGRMTVVLGGALTAAAGLAMIIYFSSWAVSLVGYFLVGMGCANIVPIMFSAVDQQKAMPQAVAAPAVTTLGYVGVLAGPVLII